MCDNLLELAIRLDTTSSPDDALLLARTVATCVHSDRLLDAARSCPTALEAGSLLLTKHLFLTPNSSDGLALLGNLLLQFGEDEHAALVLHRLQAVAPELPSTLLLAAALARDVSERLRLYESVLRADPDNAVARTNISTLKAWRGAFHGAIPLADLTRPPER